MSGGAYLVIKSYLSLSAARDEETVTDVVACVVTLRHTVYKCIMDRVGMGTPSRWRV